jgi:uncharacterized protein YqhQ
MSILLSSYCEELLAFNIPLFVANFLKELKNFFEDEEDLVEGLVSHSILLVYI